MDEVHIINHAYKLFSKYTPNGINNACTHCCLTPDEVKALLTTPLKEISVELLSTYNDSAQANHPNIDEFKYFLPRYLELIALFDFPSHSDELSLRNIAEYSSDVWTAEEREFLDQFAEHHFINFLHRRPIWAFQEVSGTLIMFYKANYDISRFLDLWENDDSISGCLHFKNLILQEFHAKRRTKISNAFATDEFSKIMYDWKSRAAIRSKFANKIEDIIMNPTDLEEKELHELSWTYELLK